MKANEEAGINKRVLIIGGRGMLGTDLSACLDKNHHVTVWDMPEHDITQSQTITAAIQDLNPEIVINCAAYTDVDGCESNAELAFSINGEGAGTVAAACARIKSFLIHISTDYVFDGSSSHPYRESDGTNPLSIYGQSKLRGEEAVAQNTTDFAILRAMWLYGENGKNFVHTILRLAHERNSLMVVNDQRGAPTWSVELSRAIAAVVRNPVAGIYHIAAAGSCTWYEFARAIFELADISVELHPCSTEQFPRPAKRPAYSVFDCDKFTSTFGISLLPWRKALADYLSNALTKGVLR